MYTAVVLLLLSCAAWLWAQWKLRRSILDFELKMHGKLEHIDQILDRIERSL